MNYISKTSSPRELEGTEPILPDGFRLLDVLKTIGDIVQDALALSRACNRTLPRRRERQALFLLELDSHLLDDIGISREQAEGEARKRLWQ